MEHHRTQFSVCRTRCGAHVCELSGDRYPDPSGRLSYRVEAGQYRRRHLHGRHLHLHRTHRRRSAQLKVAGLAVLLAVALQPAMAFAQQRVTSDRYDDVFRKYSKRYFGVGFDWQYFKAQGMAERGIDLNEKRYIGTCGML